MKKMTDPALIESSLKWAAEKRTREAEQKRRLQIQLKSQRRRGKESHVGRAKEIKEHVNSIKENARLVNERLRQKKAEHAGKERANDHLVEQEKLRVLANNKKEHQKVFEQRYVNEKVMAKFEQTPTFARPNLSSLDPSVSGGLMG